VRNEALATADKVRALAGSPLFHGLGPEDLQAVALPAAGRSFRAGEMLFLAGQEARGFFLILEGQVKLSRFGADGREQVLHLLGPGQPCGEVPVFEGGAYPATCTALSPVRALYLPREAFLGLAEKRPQVLLGMLAILSRRLRALVELVDDLALKEVAPRLARHLLAEAGGKETLHLAVSKATLAARLGTIPETLSRVFARLQRDGLLEVQGRTVRLLDPHGLRCLCGGDAQGESEK